MKTGYKTGLYGHIYDFSIGYDTIDVDDFSDIHYNDYEWYKIMFWFIKQVFIAWSNYRSLATKQVFIVGIVWVGIY